MQLHRRQVTRLAAASTLSPIHQAKYAQANPDILGDASVGLGSRCTAKDNNIAAK